MKAHTKWLVVAAVAVSVSAVNAADIVGKITLKGTPPPEKPLPMDPTCGGLHQGEKPTTTFFVVGADGGLADTFVYITKGLEGKKFTPPDAPVVLDQVGCIYTPYVSGAQTGQKILVKNSDPVLHNVHPTPTVAGNAESNKAHLPKMPPLEFTWNNPEVFLKFKCDVHPWMFSYVGLVDHPYYAVSGKDGTFTIKNVPPGTYTVEAYHRKGGKATAEVKVEAGNAKTDFTFEVK